MTIRSSSSAAIVLALAFSLFARGAFAQPVATPAEIARVLYVEGKDLRRTGDLAGSLEKLEAAHGVYATPITALEAARGNALLGHYKKAVALLESIPALPVKPNESPKTQEARTEAVGLIAQYKERLGTLRIKSDPATVRVLVDGEDVGPGAREALVVDPGIHHVVAESGERRTAEEVRVGDGETKDVVLGAGEAPPAPAPAPTAAPAPAPTEPPPPAASRVAAPPPAPPVESSTSPLVYVGFGVAGAGALVGGVTGVMTLTRASSLKRDCTAGVCPPSANLGTTQTLGTISTISFVAAGAGLALGLGALVLAPAPASAPPRVGVRAYVAPNGVGVGGTFE